MDDQKLIELSDKYLKGIATEEEKKLLHDWYDAIKADEEEMVITESLQTEDAIRQSILSGLQQKIHSLPKEKQQAPIFTLRKKLAAASVIIFLLAAGYLFFADSQKTNQAVLETVKKSASPLMAPGGDKAILTLANGTQIVLDSTGNGALARQGAATIIKNGNQLAYQTRAGETTEILYNTLTVPRGGRYQLVLPDGTAVWLNSLSTLRFPATFTGKERRITITGEAYFEVTKNPDRPFIVAANGIEVEVLGTHFNIMAYTDEEAIKTTLVEGSVKLRSGNKEMIIKPGEQARVAKNGSMNRIADADVEQALAWKNGFFHFNETNIKEIMRQVQRWYDVEVAYQGSTNDLDFSGVFSKKAYAWDLLKVLEATETVHFKIEGKKITVLPANKN